MKCSEKNPLDMRDLLELEKKIVPKKTEVKCLLACAYRMEGTVSISVFYIYYALLHRMTIMRTYKIHGMYNKGLVSCCNSRVSLLFDKLRST